MIVDGERIRLLKTNGLFKGISESLIKPYLKPKYFSEVIEGEIIYACGNETLDLFLIVEGEVKIKFSGNGNVQHKYLSDFFGEEEILSGSIRTSSAVANTDCILFRISSSELKQLSSSNKIIADNLKYKDKDNNNSSHNIEPTEYNSPTGSNEESGSDLLGNFNDDANWNLADT